jgi:hypothetical protein
MTKAVATRTNGNGSGDVIPFDPSQFDALMKNMGQGGSARIGFLKMSKAGIWTHGVEETPVEDDAVLYVDLGGFIHGWQCWADTDKPGVQTELLGDIWTPMHMPMPPCPEEVPPNGREWTELMGLSAVLDGEPLKYSTTSHGGRNAIAALKGEYVAQYKKNPKKMIAVVSLSNDSYKHKNRTFGTVYTPVLSVVDWVDQLPEIDAMPHPPKPPVPAKKAPAAPGKKPPPFKAAKKAA